MWKFSWNLTIFSKKIKHFHNFLLRGALIDADVAHIGQEREVHNAALVFLVVRHVLIKLVVMLAGDGERAIVAAHKLQGLL